MKPVSKVILYTGLVIATIVLANLFGRELSRVNHNLPGASKSRMMSYFAGFLGVAVVLGIRGGRDIARFCGERAEHLILEGGRVSEEVPELVEAQQLRLKGDSLEGIRILRDYLERNPHEVHVMGRIAEIYTKDLKNHLAAALEYEEMMKHKLPAEQWGWAALHLAKLYGRLNQPEKAVALLDRLEADYGDTTAGRRARSLTSKLGPKEEDAELEEEA